MVVGFEGNRFTGRILAELRAAREKGIIRIVDLCVIKKDEQGNVKALELSDLSGEEAAELGPLAGDLLRVFAEEDIEQTGAIGLWDAIKNARGIPVAGGLVAPDVLQELEEELEMAKQNA